MHIEMTRFDGQIVFSGLPLVRYTTEARLDEIITLHEDNGCLVFNPHRYTLEEGGMKRTDRGQLDFKKEADPKGMLNPGKMIGWENPDFDLDAGRAWLFEGLQDARSRLMRVLVAARPSGRNQLQPVAVQGWSSNRWRPSGHQVDRGRSL